MDGLQRNQWTICAGIGGRFAAESVVDLRRNTHEQGHSLKAVADVLGHRHLATTFIYAKVDFPALEAVPLPWPEEEER